MASRLERLVILIDTGSTKHVRDLAASQLGDWQKQHPDEFLNLLARVAPYSCHKNWETRITAAKAVGKICENAPLFDPNEDSSNGTTVKDAMLSRPDEDVKLEPDMVTKEDGEDHDTQAEMDNLSLKLDDLNLENITKYGRPLLRAARPGEADSRLVLADQHARTALKKRTIKARLGLLGYEFHEDDSAFPQQNGADLTGAPAVHGTTTDLVLPNVAQNNLHGMVTQVQAAEETGLSNRQLNALKRKRKREAQKAQHGRGALNDFALRRANTLDSEVVDADVVEDGEANKPGKVPDYLSLDRPCGVDEDTKLVKEFKGPMVPLKSEIEAPDELEGLEWTCERLCDLLKVNLFDSDWETRHGAAFMLKEIIRVQSYCAGRKRGFSRAANDALNQEWLEDCACRLCCVLMLDRFTDYSSDTSVAPIREAVGQTLGSVLRHARPALVKGIYEVLHKMVIQPGSMGRAGWPICHGGMVGLRYVVAVRKDVLLDDADIFDGVIECVKKGLADADDDVRSASAATLIPIAQQLVQMRPQSLDGLVNLVWESLTDLADDLSASTGRLMDLLATLCSFPEVLHVMQEGAKVDHDRSFTLLVPRLYPFLRHTITSVRLSVLKALMTFADLETEHAHGWLSGRILRLVFQNIVLERDDATLDMSMELWIALVKRLASLPDQLSTQLGTHAEALLALALHPIGLPRNPIPMRSNMLQKPSGGYYNYCLSGVAPAGSTTPEAVAERPVKRRRKSNKVEEPPPPVAAVAANLSHDVDGPMVRGEVDLVGMDALIRSRVFAARAVGLLMALAPQGLFLACEAKVREGIESTFSTTRLTACITIHEYAKCKSGTPCAPSLHAMVASVLELQSQNAFQGLVSHIRRLRIHCQDLINLLKDQGKVPQSKLTFLPVVLQGEPAAGPMSFTIEHATKLLHEEYSRMEADMAPSQRLIAGELIAEAHKTALSVLQETEEAVAAHETRIKAAAACALVAMQALPKKPGPVIKAIMDSVKTEQNQLLQSRSAAEIAQLLRLLVQSGRQGPADKVVANLVKFSCLEVAETPEFPPHALKTSCILSMQKEEDRVDHKDAQKWAREAKAARITRRGAKEALEVLSEMLGPNLFTMVPKLRAFMEDPLRKAFTNGELPPEAKDPEGQLGQEIVDAMSVIRLLTPRLHVDLRPFIMEMLPFVIQALHSELSVLRYMAAKCFATVCSVMTVEGITILVEKVLPSISNPLDLAFRQGATEAIYHLIATMGDEILPYVVFLIVPVLGRMSDSDTDIRMIATTSFATLVKLVPLEMGIPDPPGLSRELLEGRDRERQFIGQLLDHKRIEPFTVPVAIKAELRSYQQEGVNWLNFLKKYHLHGILCDDMGLGKTLQTITIVASDHHERQEEFARTGAAESRRLPSLIICPPTLSGHWQQEIKTYAPFLSVTAYVGPPAVRRQLRDSLATTDLVITSYDVCRNEIDHLHKFAWNYVVLDEGHLIKNPRAKTTIAVKQLNSNHRLILTGTPIQNHVLELWSLFDFLMPGFLGSEKVFSDRFAKPIAASRYAKASSKEQEAGALATEALHKQVLPFLLRRLKEEVLEDLPPKMLQNYYCDLSELQRRLFEEFTKREGGNIAKVAGRDDKEAKQHIFQALQYMRKLCNSPALVMKPGHKLYDDTQRFLAAHNTTIEDPAHAPKLTGLKDLLVECGIGIEGSDTSDPLYQPIKAHRALIFCQMKEMLDMVQNTVLNQMLPSVSYLRLDGSVEASRRQDIVNKFNSDPSYDVLLLTTSVGGLGLNLTGADTVIFVEHDWNPQKDLQAMDRAHRIGQKKVVNVYRLITRGTLEEKILSLQRFKIDVASTVVNQQNAGLATMDTDQILDLFSFGDDVSGPAAMPLDGREEDLVDVETGEVRAPGKKGYLDDLGELWDSKQYEDSFDLDGFLKTMQ